MAKNADTIKASDRWVRKYIRTFQHDIFADEPFTEREAWDWLICQAAWCDTTVRARSKVIPLQRGQLAGGRAFLASHWKWSEKRVRTFLQLLASEKMIEMGHLTGQRLTIITVCNYTKYQPKIMSEGQQKASSGPARGQLGATIVKGVEYSKGAEKCAREEKSDWEKAKEKIIAEYEERAQ